MLHKRFLEPKSIRLTLSFILCLFFDQSPTTQSEKTNVGCWRGKKAVCCTRVVCSRVCELLVAAQSQSSGAAGAQLGERILVTQHPPRNSCHPPQPGTCWKKKGSLVFWFLIWGNRCGCCKKRISCVWSLNGLPLKSIPWFSVSGNSKKGIYNHLWDLGTRPSLWSMMRNHYQSISEHSGSWQKRCLLSFGSLSVDILCVCEVPCCDFAKHSISKQLHAIIFCNTQ